MVGVCKWNSVHALHQRFEIVEEKNYMKKKTHGNVERKTRSFSYLAQTEIIILISTSCLSKVFQASIIHSSEIF